MIQKLCSAISSWFSLAETPLSKLVRRIGKMVDENKKRAEDEDPEEKEWYRAIK